MIKLIFRIAVFVMFAFAQSAYAAFTYEVSAVSNPKLINTMTMRSPSCSAMAANANPMFGPYTCEGFDSAVEAATKGARMGTYGHFTFMEANAQWTPKYEEFTIRAYGSCTAGADAGTVRILTGYVRGAPNGEVVQSFELPSPWSKGGCLVMTKSTIECSSTGDQVAPNIYKGYCTFNTQETGEIGGAEGDPEVDEKPYTGGGDTGSGNTGGGNTGGGNTGGGNTGGGNTGGGNTGGGNTGGGNTGGGNTGGGNTGGGNTGGGNNGGGSGTDFCANHPGSMVCINSSVAGGCSDFICTGDAIQCATLREAHDANCKIAADEAAANSSGIGKLGKGVLDGVDPDGDKLPTPHNGKDVSLPELDQSGWLGGGQCFADKTFTVGGRQFTVPFSQACSALIVFRYAIMIVALLASFRMLSGAVIRE